MVRPRGFIAIAVVGTVLVAANDEPMGAQVPYIVAFSMFGAVGATIVSRDRRNAIGVLLLWGLLHDGDVVHRRRARHVARRARGRRPRDPAARARVGLRVAVRDPPGPLPPAPAVPRRTPSVAPLEAVPLVDPRDAVRAVHRDDLRVPDREHVERHDRARQPALPRGSRRIRDPRRVLRGPLLRDVGRFRRVRVRPLPAGRRRRTPTDQVGRVRAARSLHRDLPLRLRG